ncbi:MAG: SLBB domain-containing protein [Pyrinomonadaceae bacterium]
MRSVNYLFVLMLAVCATNLFAQNPIISTEAPKGYLIGPGDVVVGKVLGEPQFDFESTVDPDGRLSIPFVDQPIAAACKTELDLKSDVTKLLGKYLKVPQISLRVTQRNSRPPVNIYGAVQQQQQVNLTRRARLLELISVVGGVTERAGGMVQVFRTRPPICADAAAIAEWKAGTAEGMGVPSQMYSLASLRQGREEANPEIFAGDIIVVQKAAPVYITGEVRKPGELDIPEGGLPLTQAIAMSSGLTREAKKNIKIYRRKPGSPNPEVIAANFEGIRKGTENDPILAPFDIVEVGKAPKKFTDYLLEFVTGIPGRIPITY